MLHAQEPLDQLEDEDVADTAVERSDAVQQPQAVGNPTGEPAKGAIVTPSKVGKGGKVYLVHGNGCSITASAM